MAGFHWALRLGAVFENDVDYRRRDRVFDGFNVRNFSRGPFSCFTQQSWFLLIKKLSLLCPALARHR